MANATMKTLDEATQEPENGIEIGRSWIAAILVLLAVGVYLNADIQKRHADHTDFLSRVDGPIAVR